MKIIRINPHMPRTKTISSPLFYHFLLFRSVHNPLSPFSACNPYLKPHPTFRLFLLLQLMDDYFLKVLLFEWCTLYFGLHKYLATLLPMWVLFDLSYLFVCTLPNTTQSPYIYSNGRLHFNHITRLKIFLVSQYDGFNRKNNLIIQNITFCASFNWIISFWLLINQITDSYVF